MNQKNLLAMLADAPVVASVKDEAGLEAALQCDVPVVFLLFGDILNIGSLTERIHAAGKAALVHLDLIEGLAAREVTVDYIAGQTDADGVISTKPQLLRRAAEMGLVTVQRFFLLDSMAIENIARHLDRDCADFIEVLPGLMPKIIRRVAQAAGKPIIAGGLIEEKEDVLAALAAGAVAVSASNPAVWAM